MKKFLASAAIIVASSFALNANAATNSTATTGTNSTETTVSPEVQETEAYYCGHWYYYRYGIRYYGGRVICY